MEDSNSEKNPYCEHTEESEYMEENNSYTDIKEQCNCLVETEKIQKEEALKILNLFHDAEKKFLEMIYCKQREIESLKNDIIVLKLTNKNTEVIQQLCNDNIKLNRDVTGIKEDIEKISGHLAHVLSKIKK